jgi:hypothetical protein
LGRGEIRKCNDATLFFSLVSEFPVSKKARLCFRPDDGGGRRVAEGGGGWIVDMTHLRRYSMSPSVNVKFDMKRKHSSSPAKMVNSPLNGLLRNSRSKAAVRVVTPLPGVNGLVTWTTPGGVSSIGVCYQGCCSTLGGCQSGYVDQPGCHRVDVL